MTVGVNAQSQRGEWLPALGAGGKGGGLMLPGSGFPLGKVNTASSRDVTGCRAMWKKHKMVHFTFTEVENEYGVHLHVFQ